MRDRRCVLRGLAALPLAGAALPALASPPAPVTEPLVDMHRRAMVLLGYMNGDNATDEGSDRAYDELSGLQQQAFDLRATTVPGALASLKWAREEFARYYVEEESSPDWMDRFTLAMLDSALGVLRQAIAGGRA